MTCVQELMIKLKGLPTLWAKEIAEGICKGTTADYICSRVYDCQTVSELSEFDITGTVLSISYRDEHNVNVSRTYDFADALKESLVGVDPACIDTQQGWDGRSFKDKWQGIVDKICDCCNS